MGNSSLDSRLSLTTAGHSPLHLRHLALEGAKGSDALGDSNDARLKRRKPVYVGERYDWNRSAGLAAAIYVHRHGGGRPSFLYSVPVSRDNGPFSAHEPRPPPRWVHVSGAGC